jgi:polyisoprenyl-teichoic acid--peptidoglycan teichoic acid transferase
LKPSRNRKGRRRRTEDSRSARLRSAVLIFAAIFLGAAALYWVGITVEQNNEKAEPRGDLTRQYTVIPTETASAVAANLQLRPNLTALLMIGIGHHAQMAGQTSAQNDGQADYLLVLVIDDGQKTITPIQIDRDTVTDTAQNRPIHLAYAQGDGSEQSCLQTRDAVCQLLLGMEIPYYLAIDFNAAVPVNDALGGIVVRLADDFTSLDPAMVSGTTLMLQGQQPAFYLDTGIGTSETLMARQQAFWEGCYRKLLERASTDGGASIAETVYNILQPYLTTNLSRGKILNMVLNTRRFQTQATVHPAGTYSTDAQGAVTFHADQASLTQLVEQVFYQPAAP